MTLAAPAPILTKRHIEQYREEGWCLLENVIPPEHLALLRDACQQTLYVTYVLPLSVTDPGGMTSTQYTTELVRVVLH